MASTNATGRDGGTHGDSSAAERWSCLPDDLLNIIYLRLAAPIDRARFAAVCTGWRAVATMHLARGVLPWLMLDPNGGHGTKYVYSPGEGMVLPRLSLPSEAACQCFVGCHHGGWVASSEMIVNLFSGAQMTLSRPREDTVHMRQRPHDQLVLRKIIFSKQPTVSGCILAAITNKDVLAFCMVGCPEAGWKTPGLMFGSDDSLMDIAFCNGELYGITRSRKLNKYELGVNEHGVPVLKNIHKLCIQNDVCACQVRYIIEILGKLVLVASSYLTGSIYGPFFMVLELVDADKGIDAYSSNRKHKWEMINSLGEYALFLGPTCSKAVRVPVDERGNMQRNHIYFCYHCCLRRNDLIPKDAKVILTSLNDDGYRLFYEQDGHVINSVYGIMLTGYYTMGGVYPPMWLFP